MNLREEIIRLGPWHLDVQVTADLSTGAYLTAAQADPDPLHGRVSFIRPREAFQALMRKIYPEGLRHRSVLDCACNCGGYVFWCSELGASTGFGFDIREHWIRQARFLADHRPPTSTVIDFEVCDLYDLPKRGLPPFDITIFKGIFYHLPDPIGGLRIAADLTREILILNTATRLGLPDGLLAVSEENREQLMSGIYGLNWFPTGPDVLRRILLWMGFREVVCTWNQTQPGENQAQHLGRIEMVAARQEGMLAALRG